MVYPSEFWAQTNPFMIIATMYHLYGAVIYVLLLFNEPTVLYDMPILVNTAVWCGALNCVVFGAGVVIEFYLLYFTKDDVIMTLYAAYMGYTLLSYATILP